MMKLLMGVLLLFQGFLCAENAMEPEMLMLFPTEQAETDSVYRGFHHFLREKFGRELKTEFLTGATDLPFAQFIQNDSLKKLNIRVIIESSIKSDSSGKRILLFKIMDTKSGIEQEKEIDLSLTEKEDAAQIVILKLRNFLETSILARLNVTSVPLGLSIVLNHQASGITPKEFLLKGGPYFIEVSGDFLNTYRDKLDLKAGTSVNVNANLEFSGHPTGYWVLASVIATWQLAIALGYQSHLQSNYDDARNGTDSDLISNAKRGLDHARYFTISMTVLSVTGWLGTTYSWLSNKRLKSKLFSDS